MLSVLGSPLNLSGNLKTFATLRGNKIIDVNSLVRLPRATDRFIGLIEDLFEKKTIKKSKEVINKTEQDFEILLKIRSNPQPVISLINEIKLKIKNQKNNSKVKTLLFSRSGTLKKPDEFNEILTETKDNVILLIGLFPRGEPPEELIKHIDLKIKISEYPLESWIVANRIIGSYEPFFQN